MKKPQLLLTTAFALLSAAQIASAQSIGCKAVAGGNSGIDNAEANSMLPTDLAGVTNLPDSLMGVQSNWNNFGASGSGTFSLADSLGNPHTFVLQWDSYLTDTVHTYANLNTSDGKLFDEFWSTWGPGNGASPLGNNVSGASANNQPLVYISGMNAWYTSIPNAEGYAVVFYASGYTYYEQDIGYIESVSGSPTNSTMVEGSIITPQYYLGDSSTFAGTYVQATGTSSGSATYGANYMFFTGLTNDALLLRVECPGGYTSSLNAFQLLPILPAPPTAGTPTFSPGSEVYAFTPVTVTETAAGDPFHTNLWYQWFSDNATGGPVTNAILNATNSTLNVLPTNNATTYNVQYLCVVSNIFGASTSAVAALTVDPAVAPFLTQDTTPGPGNGVSTVYAYAGGSVSFTAAFGGTPGAYLWQSNSANIPGATTTTLTLNNLSVSASASYDLTDTNTVGGTNSTPTPLVVQADPAAPTSAGAAYPYALFTNGPVAYWRFSETISSTANSVQAYDYSGNNHDATYGTGASDYQYGPTPSFYPGFETLNTGVTLANGTTNSFLTVPSLNLNTNTVTISAWVLPTGTVGNGEGLFMWRGANGDAAGLGFFGGNSSNSVAELGYNWNSNSASTYQSHSALYPPYNQWSFVTLVITPTNSTIYLYYIDQTVFPYATNLFKSVQNIPNQSEAFSGGTIWIGSDNNSAGNNFNGTLDEVSVFNKSLSETQVQGLFLAAIGASGVAPAPGSLTVYPSTNVYSGQNVRLTGSFTGTDPISLQWQSSPNGTTWTNILGANSASVLVNPLTVGTEYYQLIATNPAGGATSAPAAVMFNALPPTPPGLWTVNYQVTNNVLNYTTGGGIGHYTGRGILGTGNYWNVLPDTGGAFGYIWQITSASDLRDDGATHSGIYTSINQGSSGFGSSTAVQPDSSDIGNLLYQWVTVYTYSNTLSFQGLPDGIYNLCCYGCDGYFNDRGTTFTPHGVNGSQTNGTVNASPILPLQQGVNFVVFTNVQVAGGTLYVDIGPTTPVPTHNPNGEADFNGVQIQLVSYTAPPPQVHLNNYLSTNGVGGSSMNLSWPEGILQTATNVLGPWTPIYSPSPVTIPVATTNRTQFFRVKVE